MTNEHNNNNNNNNNNNGKRTYRKRKRAQDEDATRQRITEATVKLHTTLGPAQTTISGVAKEAGVQRATVYRHFPDEEALFDACTAHYNAAHPPPDPTPWTQVRDPSERLRQGLSGLYAYYRGSESMLELMSRDAPLVRALDKHADAFLAYLDAIASILDAGRPERGHARRRVRAAIGHAIQFTTWQTLARQQGLDDLEAVAMMAAMVESAAAAAPVR